MQLNRRKFILTGLIAAPAVIAMNHLMPIKRNPLILPYKGRIVADAGFFYCPYVPLTQYGEISRVYMRADGSIISFPSFSIRV